MANKPVQITMTPKVAQRLLRTQSPPRPINPKNVWRLAMAIRGGQWRITGDTVHIDKQGRLINGAHRLQAVVATSTPVEMLVYVEDGSTDNHDMWREINEH